ncbi:sensor histidine kinase [Saccharopolyspora cebuensis]|uniref:Sensor histidine kinase n=1 Tax=Saccharopolyspora cebuensis TaxID=418759 RepID=A0ABV4CG16_9PSEU
MSSSPRHQQRLHRLRRYTWWTIVPTAPVFALMTVLMTVLGGGDYSAWHLAVLLPGLVLVAVQGTRFSLEMMRGLGSREHRAEQAVTFGGAVALVVYAVALDPVLVIWWMFLPALLAGTIVAATPTGRRWGLGTALSVLLAVVCAVANQFLGAPVATPSVALYAGLITGVIIMTVVAQAWIWDVALELDRAREVDSELAVAQERLRFAADLHDIQGHHLQAIALKAELAERLVDRAPEAAAAQSAEIAELARTALRETRALVHGYRRADLVTEWANACELMRAAGIETTVDGDAAEVPPPLQPLFGALVREGTTNILRHSRAAACELRIETADGGTRVALRNDGSQPGRLEGLGREGAGSGLDGLRQRFAALGGRVSAEHRTGGWFELVGSAEEPGRIA